MINLSSTISLTVSLAVDPIIPLFAVVDYSDKAATTYTPGQQRTRVNGTDPVTICDAPASGAVRQINRVSLVNTNSADMAPALNLYDGLDYFEIGRAVIGEGERVAWTHSSDMKVNLADGSTKSGAVQDLSSYATHTEVTAAIATAEGYADTGDTATLASAEAYANGLVVGLWDDRGNFDASGNLFPSASGSGAAGAILKGDIYNITVAGTLGGVPVVARQTVRALVDAPGQTAGNWAIGLANTDIEDAINDGVTGKAPSQNAVFDALALKEASANKDVSGGYVGKTLEKINFWNAARTFMSFFTNAATAARTYTFPDKDITVAGLSDINAANIASASHGTTAKPSLVDADEVFGGDSASSFSLIRTNWTSVKAFLTTYFDTLYAPISGATAFITATGGTITTDGDYKVHSFTTPGTATFTITSGAGLVQRLVVGGGGGGSSGGGGAGGIPPQDTVYLGAGAYAVVVGAGGAGVDPAANLVGADGGYSAFDSLVALCGMGGNGTQLAVINRPRQICASGGGAGANSGSRSTGNAGLPPYGFRGGNVEDPGAGSPYPGAGGGGAGGVGSDNASSTGGAGGVGRASSITGSSVTYAGGGGGGTYFTGTGGAGGAGGGGAGGNDTAVGTAGTANTGGGGGGGGNGKSGGAGGSGIVIVRYKFQ